MDHLRVFHEVARALTSSLELEEILGAIMDKMAQFFGPERWSFLMVDDTSGELYYAIAVGENAESLKGLRVPLGEGVAGWVAATGQSADRAECEAGPALVSVCGEQPRPQYSIDCMCAGAVGEQNAGRDSTAEQQAGPAVGVLDLVSADSVRLCGDCDPECAVDDADSGTDHHRRRDGTVQRAASVHDAGWRGEGRARHSVCCSSISTTSSR